MGLDIYLYKCHMESIPKMIEIADKHGEIGESAWDGHEYESMSDSEKDACRKKQEELQSAFVASNGIPVFQAGSSSYDTIGEESIELDSKLHPDLYFKIGYFRSSYNAGGLNSIARNRDLMSLYDVFPTAGDDYHVIPNWEKSLELAKKARGQWIAENKRSKFSVLSESINPFAVSTTINSEKEALDAVIEQSKAWETEGASAFDEYSNRDGVFSKPGRQVHGVFIGKQESLGNLRPTAFIVYSDPDALGWYIKAWDVVIETCEYVLSQPDPEKYLLHWSG